MLVNYHIFFIYANKLFEKCIIWYMLEFSDLKSCENDAMQWGFQSSSLYRTEVNIRSVNATVVVWLQNDAGYQRWGPTEDRVEQLLESFRPGRERERDKAQLLSPTHSTSSPAANANSTTQPSTISSQSTSSSQPTDSSSSSASGHTNNV